MAELVHACADRPPGAARAPVIAAAKRLKLTGAATLCSPPLRMSIAATLKMALAGA